MIPTIPPVNNNIPPIGWEFAYVYTVKNTTSAVIIENMQDISGEVEKYFGGNKWSILKNRINSYKENGLFSGGNIYGIENKLKKILKEINLSKASAFSIQITSDESIQISFISNNVKSYLEYFPNNLGEELPEYIINSFINKKPIINSFSGSLNDVFCKLKDAIYDLENADNEYFDYLKEENTFLVEDVPQNSTIDNNLVLV
jgi:hypothetical protein